MIKVLRWTSTSRLTLQLCPYSHTLHPPFSSACCPAHLFIGLYSTNADTQTVARIKNHISACHWIILTLCEYQRGKGVITNTFPGETLVLNEILLSYLQLFDRIMMYNQISKPGLT